MRRVIWEGFWVGKFPSSHTALIVSSFYLLARYSDNLSVMGFATVVSLLLLYGLLEDKKRHDMLETHLKLEMPDLREFNGHSVPELLVGGFIGLTVAVVLNAFWF